MTRTLRRILAATITLAGALALGAGLLSAEKTASRAQRGFVFTYELHVPPVAGESLQSHLWIPLPQSDEYQSIAKLAIESRVGHKTGAESEYGNSYAVFSPAPVEAAAFEVTPRAASSGN
jgi:hypothetical protein